MSTAAIITAIFFEIILLIDGYFSWRAFNELSQRQDNHHSHLEDYYKTTTKDLLYLDNRIDESVNKVDNNASHDFKQLHEMVLDLKKQIDLLKQSDNYKTY